MKKFLLILGGCLLLLVLALAAIIFLPPARLPAPTAPITYTSFAAAVADITTFDAKESSLLRPECKSIVMSHGAKTARSIILWHGYTNCPKQFEEFGQRLFNKGYNVIIPRAPGHGQSDRLTEALASVTFEDFSDYIHRSVAIAKTMGNDVTAVGLSAGGTFVLWADAFEPDVDRFIAIAPVAYPRGFDPILRDAVIKYAAIRPNEFKWWNDEQKNNLPGPPHAYRRYSTRSMGIVMDMASTVEQVIKSGTKLPKPITFVINNADKALYPDKLVDVSNLFEQAGATVTRHFFTAEEGLPHDLIDVYNIKEHKDEVYNTILDLIH